MRRFFIPEDRINGNTATLTGSEARHLGTVLRLNPGDQICLLDGKGVEYEAVIVSLSNQRVTAEIKAKRIGASEPPVHITVAQAVLKEKKMDGLIRQLTELGIARWIPFQAHRSVPRPNAKRLSIRTARWKKIAIAALKQSRRSQAPDIVAPLTFEAALTLGIDCDVRIIFWTGETKPLKAGLQPSKGQTPKKIILMFGPEGGFTSREIQAAREAGFTTAALGPRILRADTATVAGSTLAQFLFGDMG